MTADIELLPLPRTLQHADDADLAAHVQDYARACVAHATAAKDAEIEALRAELDRLRGEHVRVRRDRNAAEARAERLAEALRELVALGHPRDPAIIAAKNALRDHDQEGKDG